MKGFKDFILRGNVIELAIGVVIGAAFNAVVTAIVSGILEPILAAIGTPDSPGLVWVINSNEGAKMDFGSIISSLISFLITAAAVYFIFVLPMQKLRERKSKPTEEIAEELPTSTALLTDIRDLLKKQDKAETVETNNATHLE